MPSVSETAIETTLNDLAQARLRDKCPGLLPFMVGFQLLEANEEGDRAVGIFGFEIDKAFYYMPVMFLNAQVKGMDAIYSVDSDLFIPASEGWVNQLIRKKSQLLGKPDQRSNTDAGVRYPDYRRMTILPPNQAKMAADQMIATHDPLPSDLSAPEAVRYFGLQSEFMDAMNRHPKLAAAVESFYSRLDFAPDVKVAADKKESPVVLIHSITAGGVDDLTDKQRVDVLQGGVAVMDKRPDVEKSLVWDTQAPLNFESPSTNGLYDVVMADGSIQPHWCARLPEGARGYTEDSLVVLGEDAAGMVSYRRCQTARKHTKTEAQKWLTEHGTDVASLKVDQLVILVGGQGETSFPFVIESIISSQDGSKVYGIAPTSIFESWDDDKANVVKEAADVARWESGPSPVVIGEARLAPGYGGKYPAPAKRVNQLIVRPGKDQRIRYASSKIIVDADGVIGFVIGKENGIPRSKLITDQDLGEYDTVVRAVKKVASDLMVWLSGDGLVNLQNQGFTKTAALQELMVGWGMGEDDARAVIAEASTTPRHFWVKRAAELLSFPEITDKTDGGGYMGQFTPEQVPYEFRQTTQTPDNRWVNEYRSPFGGGGDSGPTSEDETLDVVAQAGQTGDKEVFDASILGSLIKAARPTEMVEKFLPQVIAGMDRLGRLLFAIHWHYDAFQERFNDDLPELIDSLRGSFENLGDLVLDLKTRSMAGDPDFFGVPSHNSTL